MPDEFSNFYRDSLPAELAALLQARLSDLEQGRFAPLLEDALIKNLLGHEQTDDTRDIAFEDFPTWNAFISHRLGLLLRVADHGPEETGLPALPVRRHLFFIAAIASMFAFLQSNVTGPPLSFSPKELLLPSHVIAKPESLSSFRKGLVESLVVDGEAPYKLIPNVELFSLAKIILSSSEVLQNIPAARWAKLRVDFLHQRLLTETSSTLQNALSRNLAELEKSRLNTNTLGLPPSGRVEFLLERAAIDLHYGFDKKARADLDRAVKERSFQFALTGRLGKRTKYQQKDISQLVVLAVSAATEDSMKETKGKGENSTDESVTDATSKGVPTPPARPENLDLNDDTVLEAIKFTEDSSLSTEVYAESSLPETLAALDPSNQPLLDPLDAIILLQLASSINNTSPAHGLTREETLPYATRVLQGGSSNWQVYSQALLIRSRIEGYSSRTMERGLLQLQSLVDQVIAETSSSDSKESGEARATTFLPTQLSDEAPAAERLRYVFQLYPPSRWELEAELAARWVSLGGLKSALEIYERLEMWPEAALCWAAVEKEGKARRIVRKQLFYAAQGPDESADPDSEKWEGQQREPPPIDAPRLYCILGDIDQDPAMYEKAWLVSNCRYARAQRSLGRYYFARKDHLKAADAYSQSLKVNPLNRSSWFALGCSLLALESFQRAVDAFSRAVQLDDSDAEAWSNLAAALLRMDSGQPDGSDKDTKELTINDSDGEYPDNSNGTTDKPQRSRKDALNALKRAAALSFENFRIWENLLIVAASVNPPAYKDVLAAQKRIIEIRGPAIGEKCIDEDILEMLVQHAISSDLEPSVSDSNTIRPGLPRMIVALVEEHVIPLITTSRRLWKLVAKLALWQRKPAAALEANEKAWRAVIAQPGWEHGTEKQWDEVVDATVELLDAYESLTGISNAEAPEKIDGAAMPSDWRFKARSAVRGILGRGKASWEGTSGWDVLTERLRQLKASS